MRIYVAGSSAELERAAKWIELLTLSELTVTHNWPENIRAVGEANPKAVSTEDSARWASECMDGVQRAQLLWLLMPTGGSFGAFTELGVALQRKIPIVVSGPLLYRSIFVSLAERVFDEDVVALAYITGYRRLTKWSHA